MCIEWCHRRQVRAPSPLPIPVWVVRSLYVLQHSMHTPFTFTPHQLLREAMAWCHLLQRMPAHGNKPPPRSSPPPVHAGTCLREVAPTSADYLSKRHRRCTLPRAPILPLCLPSSCRLSRRASRTLPNRHPHPQPHSQPHPHLIHTLLTPHTRPFRSLSSWRRALTYKSCFTPIDIHLFTAVSHSAHTPFTPCSHPIHTPTTPCCRSSSSWRRARTSPAPPLCISTRSSRRASPTPAPSPQTWTGPSRST